MLAMLFFCNEKYTKMHDKLTVELFRTKNMAKFIQNKNFQASSYSFPITTSMISKKRVMSLLFVQVKA